MSVLDLMKRAPRTSGQFTSSAITKNYHIVCHFELIARQ
jgi:hypothetical protein